jgi:hypothetical protein
MSPINIIHGGGMLGQGRKISTKNKMEITSFKLEIKQKNDEGGKGGFYLQKDMLPNQQSKTQTRL